MAALAGGPDEAMWLKASFCGIDTSLHPNVGMSNTAVAGPIRFEMIHIASAKTTKLYKTGLVFLVCRVGDEMVF